MNPLSPFTYYRRHKGQALLLLVLIAALTLGVHMMYSLTNVLGETYYHSVRYLTRMSRLSFDGTSDSTIAAVASQIRAHEGVAHVFFENGLQANAPAVIGVAEFPILGVTKADLPVVLGACDLWLKTGRLIEPRTAEIILSEQLVRTLDLQIGDSVSREIDEDHYPTILTDLTLVGILESVPSATDEAFAFGTDPPAAEPEVRAGFVSYEYLDSHELYQPRSSNLLVIPRLGSRTAVNDYAEDIIKKSGESTSVVLQTYEGETQAMETFRHSFNVMYGFADVLVAAAAALVVGMINRIAVTRRLSEFGLLHAVGYEKRSLVRRLALEISTIACAGWVIGLLWGYTFSALLNRSFFAARGSAIDLVDPTPFLLTLPTPLFVFAWVSVSVNRLLKRMDSVAIIERGKLSMEETRGRKQEARSSSPSPLSSRTFYLRHRRRGVMLVVAIGLMVFSVALPAFVISTSTDAMMPYILSYTGPASIVSPGNMYHAVDADVLAQIRVHPDVAHVIPVKALSMVVDIPTLGELPMTIYAVREGDLQILLDAYGLYLGEGELTQPQSNQIILTSALAHNRRLGVDDTIGKPVRERDGMPTEMRVAGLLKSDKPTLAEREGYDIPSASQWAGFASYEYVEAHERYASVPTHALVLPVEGREPEVEAWLEESIASPRVSVTTFRKSYQTHREGERDGLQLIVLTEVFIVTVAIIGLSILNTIFFTQRQDEFGILYGVGHSRTRLLTRTLRESVGVVSAAWLAGAALCLAFIFYQSNVCLGMGSKLDLLNLRPWLFTLPIPLAVVAASAGTTARMLSRLDPVSIIERR
jgi:ABC-type lipoprotein release transport system permease subunit